MYKKWIKNITFGDMEIQNWQISLFQIANQHEQCRY